MIAPGGIVLRHGSAHHFAHVLRTPQAQKITQKRRRTMPLSPLLAAAAEPPPNHLTRRRAAMVNKGCLGRRQAAGGRPFYVVTLRLCILSLHHQSVDLSSHMIQYMLCMYICMSYYVRSSKPRNGGRYSVMYASDRGSAIGKTGKTAVLPTF